MSTDPTRRTLVLGSAALAAGVIAPVRARAALPPELLGACPTLSGRTTAGPFYFDPGLARRDITEGLSGLPLRLFLRVLDANGCVPLSDAVVEVWHAAATGRYSGYAVQGTVGETWLRGAQPVGSEGVAVFRTVFPGWYPGRTPHVHVRVSDALGAVRLTTQVYFPDTVSRWVYDNVPAYVARGPQDTTNAADAIFRPSELCATRWEGGEAWVGTTLTVA